MSYDDLRTYLHQLKDDTSVRIEWNIVEPDLVRAINHDQLAGLQLADAVATSMFYAVHKNQYSEVEERYLKLIAPIIYRHEGKVEGYGLKFWCDDKAEISRVLEATKKCRP
jgi:hypothetical protein